MDIVESQEKDELIHDRMPLSRPSSAETLSGGTSSSSATARRTPSSAAASSVPPPPRFPPREKSTTNVTARCAPGESGVRLGARV